MFSGCLIPASAVSTSTSSENTNEFLHTHVWPRYKWEPADRVTKPVWLYPPEFWTLPCVRLGPRHDALRAAITEELIRLGGSAV